MTQLAIVGGKGLNMFEGAQILEQYEPKEMITPYGAPSGIISRVSWEDGEFYCFSRHGDTQALSPNDIPYLANAYAMKKLGVRYWLAISLSTNLKGIDTPALVVADSYTGTEQSGRQDEFFNNKDTPGIVYYTDTFLTDNLLLKNALSRAAKNINIELLINNTREDEIDKKKLIVFAGVPGPSTGTLAEQSMLVGDFEKVISGMTNMTEYKVAKQCGIKYAGLSYVVGNNLNYLNPEEGVNSTADAISTYLNGIDNLVVPLLSEFITESVKLPVVEKELNLSGLQGPNLNEILGKSSESLSESDKKIKDIAEIVLT